MNDIREINLNDFPDLVKTINAMLSAGKTVELKPERTGLAIVEITRYLNTKCLYSEISK